MKTFLAIACAAALIAPIAEARSQRSSSPNKATASQLTVRLSDDRAKSSASSSPTSPVPMPRAPVVPIVTPLR